MYAYSGKNASTYARQYWNSYNTSYPSYSSDCTNFASQCAVAGGETIVSLPASKVGILDYGGTYMCKNYWSCKYYTYKIGNVKIRKGYVPTSTWTIVDQAAGASSYGFQDFMLKNKNKVITIFNCADTRSMNKLISTAKSGDIIQIQHDGSNRCTHSYIVGSKKKNSKGNNDLFFYAHTSNRDASSDDSLWYLLNKKTIKKSDTLVLISM